MTTVRRELPDERTTRALAGRLAGLLRTGDLVALEGDLGTGKTAFARALIQHLAGAPIEVPSPSFTLVQQYDLPALRVVHADLYRIRDAAELEELGLEEALEEGALLVEWPERGGAALPGDRLTLRFGYRPEGGEEARSVEIEAGPSWRQRIGRLLAEAGDG